MKWVVLGIIVNSFYISLLMLRMTCKVGFKSTCYRFDVWFFLFLLILLKMVVELLRLLLMRVLCNAGLSTVSLALINYVQSCFKWLILSWCLQASLIMYQNTFHKVMLVITLFVKLLIETYYWCILYKILANLLFLFMPYDMSVMIVGLVSVVKMLCC